MALDYQLDYQLTARNFSKQGHRGPVTFLVPVTGAEVVGSNPVKSFTMFSGLSVVSC